uniref:tRNA-binding domain-containing protein n=1 Tax=Chromera velia CCMP2878 TaxID=1169474 RepID=A0A0G4G7H8_9ALVE|eukprot:Cvel_20604.t1-p1 / transcript=Cvel_20604.t1 / gene=Cvel_20604 / organism=Chromera_velia_CCMP2878 / gene_product=Probable methionine--tRNA ligase, putative / transcript_product=Probable methionine--tRNA ligase, putative / location=Cvel_scaffold1864:1445-7376(+) / protein_length=667 / sequence_SO=supercontig / SO=protein_coding / is_pseudo=false
MAAVKEGAFLCGRVAAFLEATAVAAGPSRTIPAKEFLGKVKSPNGFLTPTVTTHLEAVFSEQKVDAVSETNIASVVEHYVEALKRRVTSLQTAAAKLAEDASKTLDLKKPCFFKDVAKALSSAAGKDISVHPAVSSLRDNWMLWNSWSAVVAGGGGGGGGGGKGCSDLIFMLLTYKPPPPPELLMGTAAFSALIALGEEEEDADFARACFALSRVALFVSYEFEYEHASGVTRDVAGKPKAAVTADGVEWTTGERVLAAASPLHWTEGLIRRAVSRWLPEGVAAQISETAAQSIGGLSDKRGGSSDLIPQRRKAPLEAGAIGKASEETLGKLAASLSNPWTITLPLYTLPPPVKEKKEKTEGDGKGKGKKEKGGKGGAPVVTVKAASELCRAFGVSPSEVPLMHTEFSWKATAESEKARAAPFSLLFAPTDGASEAPAGHTRESWLAVGIGEGGQEGGGSSSSSSGGGKGKGKAVEGGAAPEDGKQKKQKAPAEDKKGKGNQTDVTRLEVRVGKIVKVWKHPEAEKLWCEEIEIGEEGGPRQIASGLVGFVPEEGMMNARVLVLANLKARALVGFQSHGMVLCAKSQDGTKVELVRPPEGAKIGELVKWPGHEGEPEPQLNPKKKAFEQIQPLFKTDENKTALYNGTPFMTSAGPCTCDSIVNGSIS